ncbi:MAG: hypothetical protein JWM53_3233 [bacterium]|nr:hypothetical protein [bacterium]
MTLAPAAWLPRYAGMVRCTKCRFLFEAPTPGLLPDCRQCGGPTTGVDKIEPADAPAAQPTMKIPTIKQSAAGR